MLGLFSKFFKPNQLEYFGHLGQVSEPQKFFLEQNYIICRNALSLDQIDKLVNLYDSWILETSSLKFLRQSGNWESTEFTDVGGVRNCFLNPHSYELSLTGDLSHLILTLIEGSKTCHALSEISEYPNYDLYQTMMFDHTTTRPHQDWIYLDSRPNGRLIAAWMALEDTFEDGIRFFVYPGTQNFQPTATYSFSSNHTTFDPFLKEIDDLIASSKYEIYAPPLKKGDIFFWGSRIIHGSISGTNPSRRRKSIAAHFVPEGLEFGNLERNIEVNFKKYKTLKYAYYNLDETFKNLNPLNV